MKYDYKRIDTTTEKQQTKEEFEAWLESNGSLISSRNSVAMECTCEDGGGPTHWMAVMSTEEAIKAHLDHEKTLAELRSTQGE